MKLRGTVILIVILVFVFVILSIVSNFFTNSLQKHIEAKARRAVFCIYHSR